MVRFNQASQETIVAKYQLDRKSTRRSVAPTIAATQTGPASSNEGAQTNVAASKMIHFDSAGRIPGQYVVKFRDNQTLAGNKSVGIDGVEKFASNVMPDSEANVRLLASAISKRYQCDGAAFDNLMSVWARNRLHDFAIRDISESDVTELAADSRIDFIEPNMTAQSVTTIQSTGKPGSSGNCAPWHLNRLDQRSGLDGPYHYDTTAANVIVDVIDTGIQFQHSELDGNPFFGGAYDCTNVNGCILINGQFSLYDCSGHGTAVASMVAGKTFGVAKGAILNGLRASASTDCSLGLTAAAITNALQFVDDNAAGRVINMSFVFQGASSIVEIALNQAIDDGATAVVAVGNDNSATEPCDDTPARIDRTIRVGATDNTDSRWALSNYGTCVDVFAPGAGNYAADIGDNGNNIFTGTGTCAVPYSSTTASCPLNGTSLAAPIVSGMAALYLQNNPGSSPSNVKSVILANATAITINNSGAGSPNRLAFVGVPGNNSVGVVGTGGGSTSTKILGPIIENLLLKSH